MNNAPKCIEDFFFAKLVNCGLFGEPKEGLLDSLKERIHQATEEQCDRAAEIVIRERKSGAFPSFPVCQDALRRAERFQPSFGGSASVNVNEAVSRKNFGARMNEFMKRGGKPCLLKRDDAFLWDEWRMFYIRCGVWKLVELMDEPSRKEWTTPCELPKHFDPTWQPDIMSRVRRAA